eukprot:804966-Alexandrium_andersonii.AAC.1
MSASLVGSEMCIRDRGRAGLKSARYNANPAHVGRLKLGRYLVHEGAPCVPVEREARGGQGLTQADPA